MESEGRNRMKWTFRSPAKPGWYWFTDSHEKQVVRVSQQRAFGGRVCAKMQDGWHPADEILGWWCGPIHEPDSSDAKSRIFNYMASNYGVRLLDSEIDEMLSDDHLRVLRMEREIK
jgi:hypothetical protein